VRLSFKGRVEILEVESEHITEEIVETGRILLQDKTGIELTSKHALSRIGHPSNTTCLYFEEVHEKGKVPFIPSSTMSTLDAQDSEIVSLNSEFASLENRIASLKNRECLEYFAIAYTDILVVPRKLGIFQCETIFGENFKFPPDRDRDIESWKFFQQGHNTFPHYIYKKDSAACKLIKARILLKRTQEMSPKPKNFFRDFYTPDDSFIDFLERTLTDMCEKHSNEASNLSREEIDTIEQKAQKFLDGPKF
jgi:hypothetical protein